MGSFLRIVFAVFLLYVGFIVISAVLSILFKIALLIVIVAAAYYLFSRAVSKKNRK